MSIICAPSPRSFHNFCQNEKIQTLIVIDKERNKYLRYNKDLPTVLINDFLTCTFRIFSKKRVHVLFAKTMFSRRFMVNARAKFTDGTMVFGDWLIDTDFILRELRRAKALLSPHSPLPIPSTRVPSPNYPSVKELGNDTKA